MKLSETKLLLIFVAAGWLFSGCSATQYPSTNAEDIVIDGKQGEWTGSLTYFENPGLMLGIKNDSEYLYICMSSGSRDISRQIATRGLIFWVDPDGGSDKFKGIQFPLGMAGDKQGMERMRRLGNSPDMGNPGGMNEAERKEMIDRMAGRLKIIRTEPEEEFILDINEVSGVEAKTGNDNGVLTIELKIPLQRSVENMFAAGVQPGSKLGFGLCTPEIEKPSRSGGAGGRAMGGGMSGRGGMKPGGGMGGGMPGRGGMNHRSSDQDADIDIWLEVILVK